MKPYIIRRIAAVACVVFWIAAALAVYFILR